MRADEVQGYNKVKSSVLPVMIRAGSGDDRDGPVTLGHAQAEAIELAWLAHWNVMLRTFDFRFLLFMSFAFLVSGYKMYQAEMRNWFIIPAFVAFNAALLVLQICSSQQYVRWRDGICITYRLLFAWFCCYRIAVLGLEEKEKTTWTYFAALELLFMSKNIALVLSALFLPLNHCKHFGVQSTAVAIVVSGNRHMCGKYLSSDPKSAHRYEELSAWLDSSCLAPSCMLKAAHRQPGESFRACLDVQTFLQVLLGFIMPAVALIFHEGRAREWFYQKHCPQPQITPSSVVERLACSAAFAVQFYIGIAFLWTAITMFSSFQSGL